MTPNQLREVTRLTKQGMTKAQAWKAVLRTRGEVSLATPDPSLLDPVDEGALAICRQPCEHYRNPTPFVEWCELDAICPDGSRCEAVARQKWALRAMGKLPRCDCQSSQLPATKPVP